MNVILEFKKKKVERIYVYLHDMGITDDNSIKVTLDMFRDFMEAKYGNGIDQKRLEAFTDDLCSFVIYEGLNAACKDPKVNEDQELKEVLNNAYDEWGITTNK